MMPEKLGCRTASDCALEPSATSSLSAGAFHIHKTHVYRIKFALSQAYRDYTLQTPMPAKSACECQSSILNVKLDNAISKAVLAIWLP